MIKEALQYLVGLKTQIVERDGFSYCNKELNLLTDPIISQLSMNTLFGLLDYCETIANPDKIIIHIENEYLVQCYSLELDKWKRRALYAQASPIGKSNYNSGVWLDVEDFIIELRTNFVLNDTTKKIISLLGNITDNEIKNYSDDGITQTATIKSGINLKKETEIPSIVKLAPYRTFTEIKQPESEFIFRMKKSGDGPKCALFQLYDNMWKIETIKNLAEWFRMNLLIYPNKDFYKIIA